MALEIDERGTPVGCENSGRVDSDGGCKPTVRLRFLNSLGTGLGFPGEVHFVVMCQRNLTSSTKYITFCRETWTNRGFQMSFREKTAWISMLSMTGIYGYYFWTVIEAGPQVGGSHFAGLFGTIIALAGGARRADHRRLRLQSERCANAAR